jgi:flagellar motor switch protein FliM
MADETVNPQAAADVLSQSEVEAILASIQSGSEIQQVRVIAPDGGERNVLPVSIQKHDFRSPVFLSPAQMRRLRIKHEDFIRGLAASLSLHLRMEFGLQMARLETMTYRAMLEEIPMPSHITLFRMFPMNTVALFDISPRLGLTILDRMMGGPGHSIKTEREFTDIESAVLENFIKLVLKQYIDSWLKYQKLSFEIIEHENTARFLNIVGQDEIMLFLETEARFGDCVAGMRFMIPYRAMEGLVKSLMDEVSGDDLTLNTTMKLPTDYTSPAYNVPVPISAHWRGLSMTLNEINNLTSGDILLLDEQVYEKAILDLGAVPKFKGVIDRSDEKVRIKISEKTD